MNSKDNSLQKSYPELCKEWHFEKNGELLPENIRPKSGKKVWWLCNQGHEWQTKICTRTSQATGCPYCSSQTSDLEIRILCELKTIFSNIMWRKKIEGIECDVYLPKNKVAIEVDGYFWHKHKISQDKKKNNKLRDLGIVLARLREKTSP